MENLNNKNKSYQKIKSETFNIEKALQRIEWRFTNENVKVNESKITVNELDQKSVEFISNWIKQQKEETLEDHKLFAKLFVYSFIQELIFYKGDPRASSKKLKEKLRMPLEDHYKKVIEVLNMFALNNYCESIGICQKHPLLRNGQENENNSVLSNENEKTMLEYMNGIYNEETVFKSLNNNIIECINELKNLK